MSQIKWCEVHNRPKGPGAALCPSYAYHHGLPPCNIVNMKLVPDSATVVLADDVGKTKERFTRRSRRFFINNDERGWETKYEAYKQGAHDALNELVGSNS